MKTAFTFFLAAALVGGVSSGRVLQNIPQLGLGPTRPATSTSSDAEDEPVTEAEEDELIDAIEADDQVNVVSTIELGAVQCDDLADAEDAPFLSFSLLGDENFIAERTSYTVTGGDAFTDDVVRMVWKGQLTEPEQGEDEAFPRTVSMTWGEECDPETFLLKLTMFNLDGTTNIVKTVPCFGLTTETCVLEVEVEFEEADDALIPDDMASTSSVTTTGSPSRRLMEEEGDTVMDVMVLYSVSSLLTQGGITPQQMETIILDGLMGTNEAMVNSNISAYFNPVHIGVLPYELTARDSATTLLDFQANANVASLRDLVGADLVQMVGDFDNSCGRSFVFNSEDIYGYSIVKATCFDNFVHTHVYGHNVGCHHNREDTAVDHEYAHGLRYCDGEDPYRTVMSFSCGTPRVNYFSNPNVTLLNKPTDTVTENNARAFGDNMVAVSNYRDPVRPPTPAPTTVPPTTAPTTPVPTTAPPTTVPPTTTPPPASCTLARCYEDSSRDRVLTGRSVKGDRTMTTEVCEEFCEGSPYFGTEFGTECFCGVESDNPSRRGESTCTFACAGDGTQTCGGRDAITVYDCKTDPPSHEFLGCWRDSKNARIMDVVESNASSMTNELCADICAAYPFYGTQFGRECWCGDDMTDHTIHGESTSCDRACPGDADTICGGFNAMSVWGHLVQ